MILRRIARPMLGATFVFGGINALRYCEQHAQAAEPLLDRTLRKQSEKLPEGTPTDAESLIRIDAAVKIVAGTALALGAFPRVSAALLIGSLVPTTAAGHPFWEQEDSAARQQELAHFLKNAGLAGGLLLAVVDTEGKPSVGWRARQTVRATSQQVSGAGR
ncbi:DoxX family protein, partial [Streptomyces oceani]